MKNNTFPRRMIINEIETFNDDKIAASLNYYFVNIGANLAANIPECETPFISYIDKTDKTLIDMPLSGQVIKNAWNSLKRNKASVRRLILFVVCLSWI